MTAGTNKPFRIADSLHLIAMAVSFGAHLWLGLAFVLKSEMHVKAQPRQVARSAGTPLFLIRPTTPSLAKPLVAAPPRATPTPAPPRPSDGKVPDQAGKSAQLDWQRDQKPRIPLLASTEPHYFVSEALTVKPVVLLDVVPSQALSLLNQAGRSAVLRLLVNEQGEIDRVVVEQSALSDDGNRVLMAAFAKMKFRPGEIDGRAVKSMLVIEVKLDGPDARTQ